METSSPHEKDMQVNVGVSHRIDLDFAENVQTTDNVQTPIAHGGVNYDGGFEGTGPLLNLRFKTMDEAWDCIKDYARKSGFSVRKNTSHKDRQGIVRSRRFSCSREGYKKDRPNDEVKRHRGSTRTGCSSFIYVKLQDDGIYTITRHQAEHNHKCTPNKSYMFRSQKEISVGQAYEGDLADSVGIRPDLLSTEAGGSENLEFLSLDCKNYLHSKRMKSMELGDAGGILEYLENMLAKDPGSIYRIQLDQDDKMANIFWADSKMVIDYHAFGDVVCFDTTFRTNDYHRPFAPFIGVNHHRQIVVFGVALMYDETIPSFEFVFEAFVSAMSSKAPTTILTDQDKALSHAISKVLPNTNHRICIWHMHQNAMKNLRHVYTDYKSFKADFNKCIYENEEEVDFLDAWERMLEKYNLRDNEWLKKLFEEKEKWALAYGRNTFCAEMNNTQQSEYMNSIIRKYLDRSYNLLSFFSQWDKLLEDRRKKEDEADFKISQSTPNLMMNVPVLVDAGNKYTAEVFKLFQVEYEKGMSCTAVVEHMEGTTTTYKVHSLKLNRDYIVTFDSVLHNVECCCKKFEFSGILCGHALSVFYRANLTQVPNKYILRRWSKDAKQHIGNTFVVASKDKMTTPTRYKDLMRTSVILNNTAAKNQEAYEMALDVMNDLMKKLKENYNVASQCEPPNNMGAEPRSKYDILDMIDDGRILCSNDNASISSQVMGVGQKEKGSKGGKRKKSALEKTSQNKFAKAKAPKDSTSRRQPTNAHLPTLSMDQDAHLPTLSIDQPLMNQNAHLPTLSMDQPLMNQQEQHLQASLVLGMRLEMIEPVEYALLPTASNSDGFAQANIRMERSPWRP